MGTSADQIEGGRHAGGRGESIWDRFVQTPGTILGNETGDVGCVHYNRWSEEIRLMAELGVTAYRLSVAWTRILPEGTSLTAAARSDENRIHGGCPGASSTAQSHGDGLENRSG